MNEFMFGQLGYIANKIRTHNLSSKELRLLKLVEECGEVCQAFIGTTGANARKGITHTREDIAKELCDVIITAFVALYDYNTFPPDLLRSHINQIAERCKIEGS